ncbi:hypothetical protein BN2537_12567 [Streptomyces venezuelae]|nr:hypothetical protein BN2537_12567 [Streptomyces venezuelae]
MSQQTGECTAPAPRHRHPTAPSTHVRTRVSHGRVREIEPIRIGGRGRPGLRIEADHT